MESGLDVFYYPVFGSNLSPVEKVMFILMYDLGSSSLVSDMV